MNLSSMRETQTESYAPQIELDKFTATDERQEIPGVQCVVVEAVITRKARWPW